MSPFRHAFRILGGLHEARRLTDGAAAFSAHAGCDDRAEPHRECYLSAYWFDDAIKARLRTDGVMLDVRGFAGPCWSPWLWVDIDRENAADALDAARRFVATALERYTGFDEDDMLYFWSGSKGVHVGVPTAPLLARPSPQFPRVARRFALMNAAAAGVTIDTKIYDPVRPFRAPNSRHPKTGRHKRRLAHRELMHLSADAVLKLSTAPAPFDLPADPRACEQAAADWLAAEIAEAESAAARTPPAARTGTNNGGPLQRDTLDFIHGVYVPKPGEREQRVFRAAANLAEAGVPPDVVRALVEPPARDCGLKPAEVAHAIKTGCERGGRG